MSAWVLVPCLVQLRTEFNTIAPGRDRASDGAIADSKHGSSSDHCADEDSPALRHKDADRTSEVHAIDVDRDLRTPGLDMEDVVQHILARCRSGAERRLRYIIFDRRIWEASNGWRQRTYTGPNPHDRHVHFSSSYETAREASKASWHLEELVALSEADLKKIAALVTSQVKDTVNEAIKALTKTTPQKGTDGKPDGTNSTPLGHHVLSQGIPNGLVNGGAGRDQAWEVFRDLGIAVRALDAKVTAALAKSTEPPAA